jgi:hypothetical protein
MPRGWLAWLLWLVGFAISVFLLRHGTDFLWKQFVLRESARKNILGNTWIEGTWLIQTIEYSGETATEVQVGLAKFGFESPDLSLSCQVTSIMLRSRELVETKVTCIFLSEDLHYLHSFRRHVTSGYKDGAAYGEFLRDPGKKPDRYRGEVIILNSDEGHNRKQIGRKLTDHEVLEAQEKYDKDKDGWWRQRALQDSEWVTARCVSLGISSPPEPITTTTTAR